MIAPMDKSKGYVAAVGVFDGVHQGHRSLLAELKKEAKSRGLSTLVLTFDSHPLELIRPHDAPRRLCSHRDREKHLLSEGVDKVEFLNFTHEMRKMTGKEFLTWINRKFGVKVLVVGFNNRFGSDRMDAAGAEALSPETGVEIVCAREHKSDAHPRVSSSAVREAIVAGDVLKASELLGRPYVLSGKVIAGSAFGRKIGFPTANIVPLDSVAIIPAKGVYIVDVRIEGEEGLWRGMTNIGVRPTVSSDSVDLSIETHIFDLDCDLYGKTLHLSFLEKLRSEEKFSSLEELCTQLRLDAAAALNYHKKP